jgi:hypothetical protein
LGSQELLSLLFMVPIFQTMSNNMLLPMKSELSCGGNGMLL